MPKVVDEKQRKDEIAAAAVQVFAENGFSQTSVQQVADAADVSKGSIYLYYDSKIGILDRVFQNFRSALHDAFDRTLNRSEDPLEKFDTLLTELVEIVRLNRSTIKVLFDFWSHSLHTPDQDTIDYETFYRQLEEKLVDLLEEGAQAGVIRSDWDEELPSMMIGLFEGQIVQWLVNPDSPPLENVKETGYRLIMNGLTDA
jgi:TetR/AcrR family fatty acid metabolism transcriptional regulator